MGVLELRDLCVGYALGNGAALAVDKVSLSIGEGEYLGLVGEFGLRQVDDCQGHSRHSAHQREGRVG